MKHEKMLYDHEYAANKFIEIKLYYHIGGMNYFSGETLRRGYYVSVTPIEKTNKMRCFQSFSGSATLIKPAKRFSQKELDSLAVDRETIRALLEHVRDKNKLDITLDEIEYAEKGGDTNG